MKLVLTPFLFLAGVGFALSLSAHLLALAGQVPPGGNLVMSLHVGILVVWMPTAVLMRRVTNGVNRKDAWKMALSGCPAWMRYSLYILFAYAIVNFALFVSTPGQTKFRSSSAMNAATIRGFSGHWMIFYGAAFSILYSATRSPELLRTHRCQNGHIVSIADSYCSTCGCSLQKTR